MNDLNLVAGGVIARPFQKDDPAVTLARQTVSSNLQPATWTLMRQAIRVRADEVWLCTAYLERLRRLEELVVILAGRAGKSNTTSRQNRGRKLRKIHDVVTDRFRRCVCK